MARECEDQTRLWWDHPYEIATRQFTLKYSVVGKGNAEADGGKGVRNAGQEGVRNALYCCTVFRHASLLPHLLYQKHAYWLHTVMR